MKYLFGTLLLLLWAPSTARGVDFDASLLSTCVQLSEDPTNPSLQSELINHPSMKLIADNMSRHTGVSFEQITQQKARLEEHAKLLPSLEADLPDIAAQATEFIGPDTLPSDQSIRIICGAPYDAFGFTQQGQSHLFINLAMINPDFTPHLLRHELWHVAFRRQYPAMAQAYEQADDPLRNLAYVMVNEGIGHYYSLRRRLEPSIVYDNWQERTDTLFTLMHQKTTALLEAQTAEEREELLWTSQAGVPFWQKWGATPGAVITYRLKTKFGIDGVRNIIAGGPCAFLTTYQEEAQKMPDWQDIPAAIMDAACISSEE